MKSKIFKIIEYIPIIGGLINCNPIDFFEALKELMSTLFIALSPIWLGAVVIFCIQDNPDKNYWRILLNSLKNGELIIYSTSLLAPVIYMALKERGAVRIFPSRLSSIIAVIILLLITTSIFSIQRGGYYYHSTTVFKFSSLIFIISILILYIAMVYNNSRLPDAGEEFQNQEKDFANQFNLRRQ